MAIEKINIENFLELGKEHLVVDVRSPGEFNHAHIPEACNIPLFTDEERKIVGTAYKQKSREAAIKIGLDFFGPKMKGMIEEVEKIINLKSQIADSGENKIEITNPKSKIVLIYCWRGGMRSAGVAWLLDLYGFKVYTLAGGYKKFRNYVLETFKHPFHFHILGGYTGSRKTQLLQQLKDSGEKIIDLEKIASHKGSAFGNINMPTQPSQKMFENILATELRKYTKCTQHSPIWLEDESQRIGDVNLPADLWKTMRRSPVYFLDIPFEERLKNIVQDYGCLDKEKLVTSILKIEKRLGGLETKNAIQLLCENNTIESFRILLKYYDKWYLKSLHNRENLNSLLTTVRCPAADTDNVNILLQQAFTT